MSDRIKRILRVQELPLYLFLAVVAVAHLFLPNRFADDGWFYGILPDGVHAREVAAFVCHRLEVWSSRIPMEAGNIVFVHWFGLWQLLDTLAYAIVLFYVSRLVNPERDRKKYLLILLCVCVFPLWIFYEVGVVTTSLNYLWPFTLAMPALSIAARHFLARPVRKGEYALAFPCLAIAAFQEVLGAAVLLVMMGALVYRIARERRLPLFEGLLVLLCAGMVIYALLSPGNAARTAAETALRFPEHKDMSLFAKIELGFFSMGWSLFMSPNVTTLLFTGILAYAVFRVKPAWQYRAFALLPFVTALFGGVGGYALGLFYEPAATWLSTYGHSGGGYVFDLLTALLLGSILLLLSWIIRDKKLYFLCFFLLGIGAATRISLGLSPTVWESGNRTCTYLYIAFSVTIGVVLHSVGQTGRNKALS